MGLKSLIKFERLGIRIVDNLIYRPTSPKLRYQRDILSSKNNPLYDFNRWNFRYLATLHSYRYRSQNLIIYILYVLRSFLICKTSNVYFLLGSNQISLKTYGQQKLVNPRIFSWLFRVCLRISYPCLRCYNCCNQFRTKLNLINLKIKKSAHSELD